MSELKGREGFRKPSAPRLLWEQMFLENLSENIKVCFSLLLVVIVGHCCKFLCSSALQEGVTSWPINY